MAGYFKNVSEPASLMLPAQPRQGVPVELVRWKSFDGMSISGFLYKPPAKFTGRRPVIVNIHGGPEGQSLPMFLAAATTT